MSDTNYRFANSADVPPLAAMNRQLIRDEGHRNAMSANELATRMEAWLTGEYEALLFERDVDLIGYALFRRDPDSIHLRQFYVCRPARRQEVGRRAFDWLQRNVWCAARVRIDVLIDNEPGLAFWRSGGRSASLTTV